MGSEDEDTTYLHLATGKVYNEHPNTRRYLATKRQQRVRAEAQLSQHLSSIEKYVERIRQGEAYHREQVWLHDCRMESSVCHVLSSP